MRAEMDETHDAELRSWVADANGHSEFPIQNLPFGVFSPRGEAPRGGVAIGEHILDLWALSDAELLPEFVWEICGTAALAPLDEFLKLGGAQRVALRKALSAFLAETSEPHPELLYHASECRMGLPTSLPGYTDFYAGIHHARNVGGLFRPESPLLPNYTWVPIGYHGRASSVRVSGEALRRPSGQLKFAEAEEPEFAPTQKLDFELELGIFVGARNELGEPIAMEDAAEHIAGYCLLNDWSARDVQAWEYQPLGPFLGKSFHTTISPWVVMPEALAPFRIAQVREASDTEPLPYLLCAEDQEHGALDVELEVALVTETMRRAGETPFVLSMSNARHLYWTPAQLVAHHASNGCNLETGDLLGTGTISAPSDDGLGSLLEMTRNGAREIALPNGETRTFLEDGDEVILRAHARRDGFVSIGFGECRAVVLAAW